MAVKANCNCGGACAKGDLAQASSRTQHQMSIRVALRAGEARHIIFNGEPTIVVPVIMCRSDVAMNGSRIPQEELIPESWNGRPVTLQHPMEGGSHVTANDPDIIHKWQVGQIFKTRVEGTALKGDAYLSIARLDALAPGLHRMLADGAQIDVSTGYYSTDIEEEGSLKGRAYKYVNRDLKPDHLALLPGAEGACSWADGCGVRANTRSLHMNAKLSAAFQTIMAALGQTSELNANARGSQDDPTQQRTDLISHDKSPFRPEDEMALMSLSRDTLAHLHGEYCGELRDQPTANAKAKAKEDDAGKKPADDEPTEDDEDKEFLAMNENTEKKLAAMIAQGLTASMPAIVEAVTKAMPKVNALTDEQAAALAVVAKKAANKRDELVKKIMANSDMKADQLTAFSTDALETIAGGLRTNSVEPDYTGGRGSNATINANAEPDELAAGMVPVDPTELIKAQAAQRK